MTIDEARGGLEEWLEMAVHNPIHNKYDELCGEAYKVLDSEEYKRIYDRWANGYVSCSDGYYRRR